MTDILSPAGWPNVRQLETNEFATGGANGNMNEQAKSLAARSELLKQYAALPYESKTGGYALNERVQLATGDIVRSTIASNVNNPNENTTGWVNVAAWSSIEGKPELYTKTEADTLFIEATQIGQPNGVAGLDALGKLDSAQFPLATETTFGVAKVATQAEANTGTDDATIITPKKLKDISFGRTGSYANVTASRLGDTVYTNPKNTPLVVAITAGAQGSTAPNKTSIISGDLEAVYVSSSAGSFISTQIVIVPPLAEYKLNNPLSIVKWMEW